jgi:lysozyme
LIESFVKMSKISKTSLTGISFIKSFEGFSAKPYLCSAGVATIGYGSTRYADGRKVTLKDKPITEAQASELFAITLLKYERIVNTRIKTPLTQNQFDALVSHTYNTGGSDTLFRLVNERADPAVIRKWFETRYIMAGGLVLPGLVRRRKAEAMLFFGG